MKPPVKLGWLERAVQTYNYHVLLCKNEAAWTIQKTASELNRSIGSVSQDITIASWVKTHEKQLKRFTCMKDALEFIKDKKKEMSEREIEL